jgi:hypothetical protein
LISSSFSRKNIELQILEEEHRNNSSMTVDFSMMVSFHQKYMVLHDLISETTQLYTKYWSEYLTSKPGTGAGR